nr:hypothetical protein [Tanacetum cinerariifolium]
MILSLMTFEPTKATKKSKPSAPKADLRPPVTKPVSSQQPKPKPAPAKSQEKKRKLVMETSDKPSPAKSLKPGAVEESLKSVHDAHRGLLPPVVIREPDSGKFQLLPEFIFQRRTSTPTESSGHDESSSLYDELGLTDSEMESEKEVPGIDAGVQDEGQAGPNPSEQDEGQAGPNPGDAAASQPPSSYVVHAGQNLEHMDLEATDEPASSTGTLSSLQHLAKDFSFGDIFFNDKPSEADNEKTIAETEVESMVSVRIQQDTSAIPPLTTPVIDLTSRPDSPNAHQPLQATRISELKQIMENLTQDNKYLEERLDSHGARLYTLENLDIPRRRLTKNRHERDSSPTNMGNQLLQTHEDHMMLYEALEKSMNRDHTDKLLKDLAEACKKKKKRRDSPKTPPRSPPHQPPPPQPPAGLSGTLGSPGASGSSQVLTPPPPPLSTNQEGQSHGSTAPNSSKTAASAEYAAWTTTDTRLRPSITSILKIYIWMMTWLSMHKYIHRVMKTSGMPIFLRPAFELVKVFHPNVIHLQCQMEECHKLLTDSVDESITRHNVSKPLPLSGPPGQVTIQSDFFFNKDLEYLRYGTKGGRPSLSISKMKAAYYPDVGLEQMVHDQMWIEEECKHISKGDRKAVQTHMRILSVVRIKVFSVYGYDYMKKIVLRRADLNEHIIVERDFKYLYPSDFEDLYLLNLQGHLNYLPPKDKKILTTAVNLWTRHLVIRQRVENIQLGIESYQTQLNLTKPRWDATGFEYKHDFMIIDSLRAVIFRDKYGVQMIMRFNEIHKFSDGTLDQIDKALDYRVKEFKVNRMNPGLNTRF